MHPFLLLVGGVVVVLAALKLVTFLLVQRWSETLDFQGPVRAVEVTVGKGEVTVRGSGRRDARVRRRIHQGVRSPRISEHVDDGVLRLRCSSALVRYEVDVPAGASVLVQGDVAAATVIGVSGAVRMRCGAGSLEGRALTTNHLSASTDTGSIRLSFDEAPDRVDVTTHDGEIDVVLPEGDTDLRAHGPGRVTISHR